MKKRATNLAVGFILILCASNAFAVEGGMGRPISGGTINPFAAVVPPAPGFAVSVSEVYYTGSIGGNATVPIGVNLALGLDTEISFTPVTLLYIWDTKDPHWNFASAVSLPITWLEASADLNVGQQVRHISQDTFGLFDILITPIVASYHLSQTEHLGFSFSVWAPTGEYNKKRLANLSLNNWTFIPGIAYTRLFAGPNIEFSANLGIQFYTENHATDYQNGVLTDFEFLLVKRWKNNFGIGFIGSWIDQLSEDEGQLADRLNGFSGRVLGVGPIATYSTEIGKSHLDFNARWVHEFNAINRIEGDLFQLSASWKF